MPGVGVKSGAVRTEVADDRLAEPAASSGDDGDGARKARPFLEPAHQPMWVAPNAASQSSTIAGSSRLWDTIT